MILCWKTNFVCRICQILKKETASIASCKVMTQPIRVNLVRPAYTTDTCFSALFSPEGNCSLVKKLWKLVWKFELNPLWGPIWGGSRFLLPSFFAYLLDAFTAQNSGIWAPKLSNCDQDSRSCAHLLHSVRQVTSSLRVSPYTVCLLQLSIHSPVLSFFSKI